MQKRTDKEKDSKIKPSRVSPTGFLVIPAGPSGSPLGGIDMDRLRERYQQREKEREEKDERKESASE